MLTFINPMLYRLLYKLLQIIRYEKKITRVIPSPQISALRHAPSIPFPETQISHIN